MNLNVRLSRCAIVSRAFFSAFSGQGGAGSERRSAQSAGNREVLPVTTSEYSDAVGAPRTADSVE